MSQNTVTNAVAVRDTGPEALVRQYREDFTMVLPSHVKGETWMRLATGALRRNPELHRVATNNPGSLMNALLECARLGHEPGTESFYLVPFGNEVQGIEGYRGVVERIYRAGAIKVVKAEVVYSNDVFVYSPDMERPVHKVEWFADRGEVIGAYAYGVFQQDDSTSRVVVIDRTYIEKVRKESKGSSSPKSPWVKWFDQMVLKTVARRLEPWVPTSTEWRKEQLRTVAEVAAEMSSGSASLSSQLPPVGSSPRGDDTADEDGPIDAEVVEDPPAPGGWDLAWQAVGNAAGRLGWTEERAKAELKEYSKVELDNSTVEDLEAFAAHVRTLAPVDGGAA